MMIKIILTICYVFMFVKGDLLAVTGDDIMDELCKGSNECLACQDATAGKNPVFAPCEDYGTFNKDKIIPSANGNKTFGAYDEKMLSKTCPMEQFKETCIITTKDQNISNYVDFEYTWWDITSYDTKKEIHSDSDGSYLTVSEDLKTVHLDMYDDKGVKFNYPPLDLLAEIKKVIKSEIDLETLLTETEIILKYSSIRYHGVFGWDYSKDYRSVSVMPGAKSVNLSWQHDKGIFKHPVFHIKVPIKLLNTIKSVTCESDLSLPCVSKNNGNTYFCSTSPCGVISGDINVNPDPIVPEDNTTISDNISIVDNVSNCEIQDIILFPGKRYNCRHKGEGILSNDLTSPDQCLVKKDLKAEDKEALLGGLNKFFEITSLGGIGYIAAPGQLLLKLFAEGIIENIADMPTDEEKQLSVLRAVTTKNDGSCIVVGEYCKDWTKTYDWNGEDMSECKRRASIYCCYDSPLAKAFNVAARDQISKEITWGENLSFINKYRAYQKDPSRPNCRGITVDELGKINMDDPQFSEDMNAYVTTIIIPEMSESGGMLDKKRLEEIQKNMQEDMQEFYK